MELRKSVSSQVALRSLEGRRVVGVEFIEEMGMRPGEEESELGVALIALDDGRILRFGSYAYGQGVPHGIEVREWHGYSDD